MPRSRVVPFLTTKHTLGTAWRMRTAPPSRDSRRSWYSAATRMSARPGALRMHGSCGRRCARARPELALGGWANPHADAARQVDFLLDENANADFYLTQIVSHHDAEAVERFVREAEHRQLTLPGVFGVFYYRSANPKTLAA